MLDQLRQQIQTYLDELAGEANKLRHALVALGSRGRATTPAASEDAGGRARSASVSRSATRKSAQSPQSASTTAGPARTAPGATKTAVLEALAGGSAMTAGDVASATGLGRATVSTTLSKLASSGEVRKAARGYQLVGQTPTGPPADVATSGENEQPRG